MKQPSIYKRLARAIHHIEGSGIVYIENPKSACTNIKWSLIDAFSDVDLSKIEDVHDRKTTPFLPGVVATKYVAQARDLAFLSVVRHPRTRFMSAYFDKLYHGRDQRVWVNIAAQLDLNVDEFYTPKAIIKRMMQVPRHTINPHIALQTDNLLPDSLPYNAIFHLETVGGKDSLSFGGADVKLFNSQWHVPKAKADTSVFDEETYRLIDQYYAKDYATFGYDPDHLSQPSRAFHVPTHRPFMLDMLTSRSPIEFLSRHFDGTSKDLTVTEIWAVIDRLTRDRAWKQLPEALMTFIVTDNVMHHPEMLERFKASLGSVTDRD